MQNIGIASINMLSLYLHTIRFFHSQYSDGKRFLMIKGSYDFLKIVVKKSNSSYKIHFSDIKNKRDAIFINCSSYKQYLTPKMWYKQINLII